MSSSTSSIIIPLRNGDMFYEMIPRRRCLSMVVRSLRRSRTYTKSKLDNVPAMKSQTCASTWKKDLINEMCHRGYTDPVYSNGTKYKNFYCSICNRIDLSAISCGQAIGSQNQQEPGTGRQKQSQLLAAFDINFSEGNLVGKRLAEITCLKGEIFDPFARRCRNIVCGIPGYVLQNGMCVADSVPPLR
ncbi:SMB domain-containing protein [Trichonephila clavipes]|nr:SMB domain-containing protein [Trichonephila clavipes]